MRALPLHQPFATLVAIGAKTIETRNRPAPKTIVAERVAIYATTSSPSPRQLSRVCQDNAFIRMALIEAGYRLTTDLPRGAIVCTVRVVKSEEMVWELLRTVGDRERSFGHFALGRHAWHLASPERLEPPVATTTRSQGIFFWDPPDA